MATGAVIARILTQYSDKGTKAAQKDIVNAGKKFDAFGKKATKAFAVAAVASAAFAIKLGVDSVKGAAADEKQQAALAIALRNTTGATDTAIAANLEYLDSLELQVAIDNEKLIPALQKLVTATGNLGQAQGYLSLATDVSAASGKDLSAVATAMSRAIGGNFTALTRLGLPLDKNAIKTKNLTKVFEDLAKVSKGQAAAAANTFEGQVTKLGLAFNQVKDIIGLALLPGLTELVHYLDLVGIKKFREFVDLHKNELGPALKSTTENIKDIAHAFGNIYKVIDNINKILPFSIGGYIQIAVVIKALAVTYGALTVALAFYTAAQMIATAKTQSAGLSAKNLSIEIAKNTTGYAANTVAIALLHTRMMAGKGIYAAIAIGIGHIGKALKLLLPKPILLLVIAMTAVYVVGKRIIKMFDDQAEAAKRAGRATEHSARLATAKTAANKAAMAAAVKETQEKVNQAALDAKAAMDAKKKAAIQANTEAVRKRIAKMNKDTKDKVRITDPDEYELIQLTAVELLQKKQKISDDSLAERIKLRKEELALFNSLTAKTAQYLDFLKAINSDGKLDDSELVKLMSKWNLTQVAASKYADFVYAIGDRKLSDIEIENLKNKWGLTTKQVIDYLAKIGAPVDAKGTILSAGDIAALAWKNASSALDAYNAKLKSSGATPVTSAPPTMNPPITGGVQELIDREMAIDKPFMPGDLGYLGIPKSPAVKSTAPLTGSSLFGGGLDYSRIFSSTLDNSMGLMSGAMSNSNSPTINLAVYGSVTSEQDLVQTIRQGLLQGQSSGYGLLLQEI